MSDSFRLLPLAETDLEDIWFYSFEKWSQKQADAYHADIVACFGKLASGDLSGRPVSVRDGYFKRTVGSHNVFYRQTGSGIEIVRVLHQRMDVERHL